MRKEHQNCKKEQRAGSKQLTGKCSWHLAPYRAPELTQGAERAVGS